MPDAAATETLDTDKPKKKGAPTTLELQKQLKETQEAHEATLERLETFEVQMGDITNEMSSRFDQMMEGLNALAGMSASHHPSGARQYEDAIDADTDEQHVGTLDQTQSTELEAMGGHDEIDPDTAVGIEADLVVTSDLADIDPDKLAKLNFAKQKLDIMISPGADSQESLFQVGVNGHQWVFAVGETYFGVPRYIVECILTAKAWNYTDTQGYNNQGELEHILNIQVGARHNLSILNDPASEDAKRLWLQGIMRRRL